MRFPLIYGSGGILEREGQGALAKRWINFMARQPVWIDDQSGFVRSNNFLILRLDFYGFEVTLAGR